MFMAPRHELLGQLTQKIDRFAAFEYGIIASSKRSLLSLFQPIQVASVDTLVSRVIKRKNLELPPIDNVILDEVHLYLTPLRNELMKMFPTARIIGMTATPGRHDGRALDVGFDELVEIATVGELIAGGYLVQPEYYAPSVPDMKRVKIVAGDWNKAEASARMEPLLEDIVPAWLKRAADRRTVVFANSVEQSIFLAEDFCRHGVTAEHCDGSADHAVREAIMGEKGRVKTGETQVLCNVDLATYGFDLPEISCVVLASPSRSVVRYLQRIGRGLRAAPGKIDCLVHDHAGAFYEHGPAEEDRHWSLTGIRDLTGKTTKNKTGQLKKEKLHLRCKRCQHVFGGALTCPQCGYYFEKAAKKFVVVEGELQQIRERSEDVTELERMRFYCELMGYLLERNRKKADVKGSRPWSMGWAAHAYQAKYRGLPPKQWDTYDPMPPSLATRRFVKYLHIRRRHQRAKETAAA